MKNLTVRTKITLWYTSILMLLLLIVFAILYFSTRTVLFKQSEENFRRDVAVISDKVVVYKNRLEFDLDDAEIERLSSGVLYSLYNSENTWSAGRRSEWIDSFTVHYDAIRTVEYNGLWLLYDKIIYAKKNEIGWVRVLTSLSSIEKVQSNLLRMGLLLLFPALLLSVLGGFFIAKRALLPLINIAKTATLIGDGDLSKRIDFSSVQNVKDEIGKLAQSFNKMADSLEGAFTREKQFSSDASHEIRTPLAVIMANAEEALASDDLTSYRQSTESILDKSKHLQQMLSQLLMLSRGYEGRQATEFVSLNISQIITDITEEIAARALKKQISIKVELNENTCGELYIKADLMLLTRMLMNLLENAILYTNFGGQITIVFSKESEAKRAILSICDNGEGIEPHDLTQIFKRFYRGDKARTGSGTGLGLAIVAWIAELHGIDLEVKSTVGKGTCFYLKMSVIN